MKRHALLNCRCCGRRPCTLGSPVAFWPALTAHKPRVCGGGDDELVAALEHDSPVVALCFAKDERALFAAVGSDKVYRTTLPAGARQSSLRAGYRRRVCRAPPGSGIA